MLLYEKEIELLGLGAPPYFEQRRLPVVAVGSRFVQWLIPGTPREMPVPWSVLMLRNEGLYSWGGSGAPNSPPP